MIHILFAEGFRRL